MDKERLPQKILKWMFTGKRKRGYQNKMERRRN
jgi:hypothetical protein